MEINGPKGAKGNELDDAAGNSKQVATSNSRDQTIDIDTN